MTAPKDFEPEYEKAVVAYKALEAYFVRRLEQIHEDMMDGDRRRALQHVEALLDESDRARKLREESEKPGLLPKLEAIRKGLARGCYGCEKWGGGSVNGNNMHVPSDGSAQLPCHNSDSRYLYDIECIIRDYKDE